MDGWAVLGGHLLSDPLEISHDPSGITNGQWACVLTFEGAFTAVRFGRSKAVPMPERVQAHLDAGARPERWPKPSQRWSSSLSREQFERRVRDIQELIAQGLVYQVNLTRRMSAGVDGEAQIGDLGALMAQQHPAPHAATISVPQAQLEVACVSPERYVHVAHDRISSGPIKGTARTPAQLLPKDYAENVMITDLVRNDLAQVSEPGSIAVPQLCAIEHHPGLVHLVSTVTGHLRSPWSLDGLLRASFPPGSVSGAPKSSAVEIIRLVEPVPRGPYCGAIGLIDMDQGTLDLAVGIRTFWIDRTGGETTLNFGTGSGITIDSDPAGEWAESELKAAALMRIAQGSVPR